MPYRAASFLYDNGATGDGGGGGGDGGQRGRKTYVVNTEDPRIVATVNHKTY